MTMVIQTEPWKLQPNKCMADIHFCEMAKIEKWAGLSVFHMGPGEHHLVGISLSGTGNNVLAITCSPEEVDSYMKIAIKEPRMAANYKVLFGDIYSLQSRQLPMFDVINLPHLGEMPDITRQQYGAMSDIQLVFMLIRHLNPGGKLVGYKNSSAFDRAGPIMAADLAWLYDYESLRVWKKAT